MREDTGTGTCKFFDTSRGFGFIKPDDGGPDLFVHFREVLTADGYLQVGEKVQFDVTEGRKGLEATNVRLL